MRKNFRSLNAWSTAAKKVGAAIKLVTPGTIEGYEAYANGLCVGFFQSAPSGWLSAKSFGWLDATTNIASVADQFFEVAGLLAHRNKLAVSVQRRQSDGPIVEFTAATHGDLIALYAMVVEVMTSDDPFRAETTVFHNREWSMRFTNFAREGR